MPDDESTPRENLVLVGFMGSGKSSIGRLVAQQLGFRFVDSDQLVVERARMAISQIFAEQGEDSFRSMETQALEGLRDQRQCVVSTGGGAVLRQENRRLLRELGYVVCLTAAEEVIFDRVSRNSRRPLLQTEDPRATLRELLASRRGAYEEAAEWMLDTSSLSQAEAAERIIAEARRVLLWQGAE